MLRSSRTCASRCSGRAAVAEHALEDDARVHFHRQRRGRRAPRDRVPVDAAVAVVAVADEIVLLERHLERQQAACRCRSPARRADRRSCALRTSAPSVRLGCTPLSHTVCPRECSPLPSPHDSACRWLRPVGTSTWSLKGASGRERRRQLVEHRSLALGRPGAHRRAVRRVDEAETAHGLGAVLACAESAGTIASRNGSATVDADAAQERPPGQRHLGDEHRSAPHAIVKARLITTSATCASRRVFRLDPRIWNGVLFTTPRISDWKL